MTASAQVALLDSSGRGASPPRLRAVAAAEQPVVRLVTFSALGLYGVLRWATLLSGGAEGRLLALLALSVALAGGGLFVRRRALMVIAAVLAALAAFAISGVPLSWIVNVRIAVTARAIGGGLQALPGATVPYSGINHWVRVVTVLGAGVLLFDAALLLAFAPRALGDLRRAGAALPLVALATVPATLVHPGLPYVDGFVLFGLLAAFIWGERIRRERLGVALGLCSLAAIAGIIAAPALDQHSPWLNYEALAGGLAPAHVETFDWAQTYGPIHWPRKGRAVFDVQAPRPVYWKAEDLDEFDGTDWGLGSVFQGGSQLTTVSPATIKRWTETLQVTDDAMTTSDVIAAGDAPAGPRHLSETLLAGVSPGTWTTATQIGPGDSYSIKVYAPDPSAAALAAAGDDYQPVLLNGYLTVGVPRPSGAGNWVIFPPFHSDRPAAVLSEHVKPPASASDSADPAFATLDSVRAARLMASSPYSRAYALASTLARSSSTPYAFVTAVMSYLAQGYTYSEDPPPSSYPLETFLFSSKKGYCQQFAGAMALLLRMGGVPARVATGFTTGSYDPATHRYIVSDLNAHAWVEVWFPHYGWVEFDPTPPQDPALSGQVPNPSVAGGGSAGPGRETGAGAKASHALARRTAARSPTASRSGGLGALEILGILAVLVLGGGAALAIRPLPEGGVLVTELERALARAGRPLPDGTTLSALERRLASKPEAAAYVRALRLQRFGGVSEPATARQRRALRAQLSASRGPLGRLRALWALPPRRRAARRAHRPRRA